MCTYNRPDAYAHNVLTCMVPPHVVIKNVNNVDVAQTIVLVSKSHGVCARVGQLT